MLFRSQLENTLFDSILEQDMEDLENHDQSIVDSIIETAGVDLDKDIFFEGFDCSCSDNDCDYEGCNDIECTCDGDDDNDYEYGDDDEEDYEEDDDDEDYEDEDVEELLDDLSTDIYDEYNNDYRRYY